MKPDDNNVIRFPRPWHRPAPAQPRPPAEVVVVGMIRPPQKDFAADLAERCRRAAIKLGLEPE
jgi:hypothetical protein